jgi:hypothetical protein
MQYWTICYPGDKGEVVYETLSDNDIIKQYYPHWRGKMIEKYGQEEYDKTWSEKDCIDDWVVVHWATESTSDEIEKGKYNE